MTQPNEIVTPPSNRNWIRQELLYEKQTRACQGPILNLSTTSFCLKHERDEKRGRRAKHLNIPFWKLTPSKLTVKHVGRLRFESGSVTGEINISEGLTLLEARQHSTLNWKVHARPRLSLCGRFLFYSSADATKPKSPVRDSVKGIWISILYP